jgi:hypothetical protein
MSTAVSLRYELINRSVFVTASVQKLEGAMARKDDGYRLTKAKNFQGARAYGGKIR